MSTHLSVSAPGAFDAHVTYGYKGLEGARLAQTVEPLASQRAGPLEALDLGL